MNNTKAAGASTTTDMEIAARITNGLIVRGIDKKSLAEKIGLSYSTLRRSLEQDRGDRRSLTILEIGKIANILEVSPAALLPETFKDAA